MSNDTDNLTISTKSCNHISLVKLQKNKTENTITVDITSTNRILHAKKSKEIAFSQSDQASKLFAFSFPRRKVYDSGQTFTALHGIRAFAVFWILFSSVESHLLSSATSEYKLSKKIRFY
jgi:hypothetical protein